MFLPLPSRNLPDPIFGMLIVMFDFSFIGYNDPYKGLSLGTTPPTQDASRKWRFRSGSANLEMSCHLVTSQHPGWGLNPNYPKEPVFFSLSTWTWMIFK